MKRLIRSLCAAALVVALAACSSAPEKTWPVVPEPAGWDLRFGVISDTHLGRLTETGGDDGGVVYPNNERLIKVLDWYNGQDVSALGIVGDLTDESYPEQWDQFKETLDGHRGGLRLVTAMGNHDTSGKYSTQGDVAALFEASTGQKPAAHYVIAGYHFIVMDGGAGDFIEQDPLDGAMAAGRSQNPGHAGSSVVPLTPVFEWMMSRVEYAKQADPGKPVFVFTHWPIREVPLFKNDPEVVFFGGHTHYPNSDPRAIWQGTFTSVNTAALAYLRFGSQMPGEKECLGSSADGMSTSNRAKDAAESVSRGIGAQGLIVSVKGPVVKIENYDFMVNLGPDAPVEQLPQTWIFDVSKPAEFPYTAAVREAQKTPPVFPPRAGIRVKAVTDSTVTVEFDQALIPGKNPGLEEVHYYQFDFINKKTGQAEVTRYQWSDFIDAPSLRKPVYEQLLGGLQPGTDYELRIYAHSSFLAPSVKYLSTAVKTK